jgi:Tol biopolymer transport system component
MTGINHKQAQRYLRAAADGLLRENQRALLDAHLRDCGSCRAEADELNALEARLKKNFQARWDANDGPSKNVMTTIQSRSRRIIMTNRINTGLKTAAGIAALLVLIVFLNSAVGKLRNTSVPASATESIDTTQSIQSSGLIAFVSIQDGGNYEIFTMKADGSEVTNLTNNLATDSSPSWSPDGTRIAFTSDRSGDTDIYVMNADGSSLSRLTDDRGYEDYFSWSPDGQRIVYTASENSLNQNGRLMVMNADGSNKIALMDQPGSYTFLGWSPDGQTIVYQAMNLGDTEDTRIISAGVDSISMLDGPFFEGDSGRRHYQIHWETPEQFITVSLNSEQSTWGRWNITRFYTTGDSSRYTSNNPPILATSNSPIVAIFDKTYVVESQDSLSWFAYDGAPIPSSPWKFLDICKTPGDPNLLKTNHTISTDGKHDFVSFYCGDDNGSVSFFLMNEDGTEIHQLGIPITNTNSIPGDVSWSSDGKYVTMPIANRQDQELYLFDIEKMLNDPSVQPIQLTTDGAMKYGATWQPQLKQEPIVIKATEEKPTPEPLTFLLTVQEAEALAGFDVLEPTYLPEGYAFQGASYDPQTQKVVLKYGDNPSLGVIYIYQQRGDFPIDPNLPSHTTSAPVGDVIGEYFHGAWIYEAGATTPRWDGSADYYALSWKKDGISFSVDFLGGETIPNINLNGLRDIAESMK